MTAISGTKSIWFEPPAKTRITTMNDGLDIEYGGLVSPQEQISKNNSKDAELASLRERNAELEKERDSLREHVRDISRECNESLVRILSLEATVRGLREALEGIVERYVDLVQSGDCGFWNPEEEIFVINARAALDAAAAVDGNAHTMEDILRDAETRILHISENHYGHMKAAHTGVAEALSKLRGALT